MLTFSGAFIFARVRACVRAYMLACVRAFVRTCLRACVRACGAGFKHNRTIFPASVSTLALERLKTQREAGGADPAVAAATRQAAVHDAEGAVGTWLHRATAAARRRRSDVTSAGVVQGFNLFLHKHCQPQFKLLGLELGPGRTCFGGIGQLAQYGAPYEPPVDAALCEVQ